MELFPSFSHRGDWENKNCGSSLTHDNIEELCVGDQAAVAGHAAASAVGPDGGGATVAPQEPRQQGTARAHSGRAVEAAEDSGGHGGGPSERPHRGCGGLDPVGGRGASLVSSEDTGHYWPQQGNYI